MLAIARLIIRTGPGAPAVTREVRPAAYKVKVGVRVGALGVINPDSPVVRGLPGELPDFATDPLAYYILSKS